MGDEANNVNVDTEDNSNSNNGPAIVSPSTAAGNSGGGGGGPGSTTGSDRPEEPPEDPVRMELEDEVRERDEQIVALEKARLEKQNELKQLQKEFEEEKLNQMIEQLIHKIESDRLQKQTMAVTTRLETLERDMQDKAAIHEYAALIKGVAPTGGVDAQYVMKLQNQLAKAVKKMENTTERMTEVENSCDEVVSSLRKEIAEIVEDRCRTEIELRKQLEILLDQKKEMQDEYDERIRENQLTLERLKAKAEKEKLVPKENLEAELEEATERLDELQRIHQTQAKTLREMNKQYAEGTAAGGGRRG